MLNLFVIYLGGAHEKSLIELHDIRFIAANTIEETYTDLKNWWGTPESLHIDAWGCLSQADGHDISLKNTPPLETLKKLYFVNLGGYDRSQFTELHKNVFIVAENDSKAKIKALKQILDWESYHRDYQFEIEKIVSLDNLLLQQNIFIHLQENPINIPFKFICKYLSLKRELSSDFNLKI